MIDDDDVDTVMVASFVSSGTLGWLLFLVALLLLCVVAANHDDCAKLHCTAGVPRLIEHECLCVSPAKAHAR